MLRLMLSVTLLLTWAASLNAADPPAGVEFQADVVYGKVGDVELKLNLSRPKNLEKPAACILVIHGGAWAGGDRKIHNDLTWKYAQQGYVSATIGYRLVPKAIFPAQVEDVKCAVRYLRANAEKHGIDGARIGAVGFSAGAHLAMMLGVMDKEDGMDESGGSAGQSSKVQAVVAFFGPTDHLAEFPEASRGLLAAFLGGDATQQAEAYRKSSPITYVSTGDAPILMFQGTKDPLVPWQQGVAMLEAMHKAGVPGRLELISGASHGWGGKELQRTIDAMDAFFKEQLKEARTAN